jgi:hypothetical protein
VAKHQRVWFVFVCVKHLIQIAQCGGIMRAVLLLFVLCLSTAWAQDSVVVVNEGGMSSNFYAAASLGFATNDGNSSGTLAGHFGIKGLLLSEVDLRLDGTLYFDGSDFEIGANALYNIALDDLPLDIHVGGGPQLFLGEEAYFGLGFRGGASYGLTGPISLFGELRFNTFFGDGGFSVFGLGVGAKYDL